MRTHVQKVSMCRPSRARVSRARRHRVELQIGSLRDRFVFAPSKFKQQQRHVFTHTHTSMSRSARARAKRTGMSSHSYTHVSMSRLSSARMSQTDRGMRSDNTYTRACVHTHIHTCMSIPSGARLTRKGQGVRSDAILTCVWNLTRACQTRRHVDTHARVHVQILTRAHASRTQTEACLQTQYMRVCRPSRAHMSDTRALVTHGQRRAFSAQMGKVVDIHARADRQTRARFSTMFQCVLVTGVCEINAHRPS